MTKSEFSIHEKELIRQSFARLSPQRDEVAALFYGRLFELDPSLRSLFPFAMKEQRQKLNDTLQALLDGLDHLEPLIPTMRELGRKHDGYGTQPTHYHLVGAALLWAFAQSLGEHFSAETEAAWAKLYQVVSSLMQSP